jgi:DNA-binding NarL/FixJ family response regulator
MGVFRWSKLRVLIVEKDEAVAAAIRATLRSVQTWMMRDAGSAAGALEVLGQFPADLALINTELKDTDGLKLARAIRHGIGDAPSDLPIILMSATPDADFPRRAMEAGVEMVTAVPFKRDALLKQIATLMAGRARRDRAVPLAATKSAPATVKDATARPRRAAPPVAGPGPRGGGGAVLSSDAAPKPGTKKDTDIELTGAAKKKENSGIEADGPGGGKPRLGDDAWKAARETRKKHPRKEKAATGPDMEKVLEDHATWLKTRGRKGERASLVRADLYGASLDGANLSNANLRGAVISDANGVGAQFASADMRQADLSGADLKEGNLAVANLRHANLRAARLDDAVLRQADLSGGNLQGASLKGTDLAGANLLETDLRGTDLRQATGLTKAQLLKARGDHTTLLPVTVRVQWGDDAETAPGGGGAAMRTHAAAAKA